MNQIDAVLGLTALAQDTRLRVFRLLVEHAEDGLPAGEIARALDVPQNTMSSHLSILTNAGLTRLRRDGRRVIYKVDLQSVRALLAFLVQDCCKGRPEACSALLDEIAPLCCDKEEDAAPEAATVP